VTEPVEAPATGRVAILLSTYNGAEFLAEQLASLQSQTVQDWLLYWRDDGSTDATPQMMTDFLSQLGADRGFPVPGDERLGASASFLRLLRAATADGSDVVAFADQDDVWLPEKLARGLHALMDVPGDVPALYCARQELVDATLRRLAGSPMIRHRPAFPGALTQNIATGCTLMLNRAAAVLIAASKAPSGTLHDWWSYLVVAAAGGELLFDATPVVLYRQHAANMVGAPSSMLQRGIAALRRGPDSFMQIFRQNVAALAAQPELLSPTARAQIATIARALDGGVIRRCGVLRMRGLRRQTWPETMLFRLWFMLQ
jgi:glycosyltransferase involved in cell wall biosynthesis